MTETERSLAPDVIEILSQSKEARIQFIMEDRWIDYPRAQEIMEEMDYLLRQPVRTRMEGMLLIAHTGNGKTALLEKYLRSKQQSIKGKSLYVEIPPRTTLKMFFQAVLDKLSVPSTRSENTVELQQKILHTIQQKNYRILFVDEVQNLLDSRRESLFDVLNGLKGLSNQAKIPIVLSGTETAADAVYIDEQVAGRFPAWDLPRWTFNDEYRDFLDAFEELLPLQKSSDLAKKTLAQEIFDHSDGLLGEIVKIIVRSAERAIQSGVECITKEMIEKIGCQIDLQRKFAQGDANSRKSRQRK